MITRVTIENFKRFAHEEFALDDAVVLAGPNNTGKSTLLQALATWSLALERWHQAKGASDKGAGEAITRKDFTAVPLREFNLLWNEAAVAKRKHERTESEKPGTPRLIHIGVHGAAGLTNGDPWQLTMELRYQSKEQVYVRPVLAADQRPPEAATKLQIVHCPPFSGIGAEERRMDRGAQNLEIGRGKPGDILRNLLWEVFQKKEQWESLKEEVKELFHHSLLDPVYDPSRPYIVCDYVPSAVQGKPRSGPSLDIASGGSGFHQVLLLLGFFYARPSSVFLLDEPDAHLHVILQRQVYERLREVARVRDCQLIIATHAEVLLENTAPGRVMSFLGAKPHPLVNESQRDQVREALSRLTTLDLLLAEQREAVLYCEGSSDLRILRAFAELLGHEKAVAFLKNPFFHPNQGRHPREAKSHLFALRAVRPSLRGLLILDGDNRALPEHEVTGDGLTVLRWRRYEIENYLLVPSAIRRLLAPHDAEATEYLKTQLPPTTFNNPLEDNATVMTVRASKDVLPAMFEAAGRRMEKEDFYLIARNVVKDEVHPDVVRVLDAIGQLPLGNAP